MRIIIFKGQIHERNDNPMGSRHPLPTSGGAENLELKERGSSSGCNSTVVDFILLRGPPMPELYRSPRYACCQATVFSEGRPDDTRGSHPQVFAC